MRCDVHTYIHTNKHTNQHSYTRIYTHTHSLRCNLFTTTTHAHTNTQTNVTHVHARHTHTHTQPGTPLSGYGEPGPCCSLIFKESLGGHHCSYPYREKSCKTASNRELAILYRMLFKRVSNDVFAKRFDRLKIVLKWNQVRYWATVLILSGPKLFFFQDHGTKRHLKIWLTRLTYIFRYSQTGNRRNR